MHVYTVCIIMFISPSFLSCLGLSFIGITLSPTPDMYYPVHLLSPRQKLGPLKHIHLSVCQKESNWLFLSINDRALIIGIEDPCDKPFNWHHSIP